MTTQSTVESRVLRVSLKPTTFTKCDMLVGESPTGTSKLHDMEFKSKEESEDSALSFDGEAVHGQETLLMCLVFVLHQVFDAMPTF